MQLITIADPLHQAVTVLAEIDRLRGLDPGFKAERCAILARTRAMLAPMRYPLERDGYAVRRTLEKTFPLHRVREVADFIASLRSPEAANLRASDGLVRCGEVSAGDAADIWRRMLTGFLENYQAETGDALLPAGQMLDSLFDFLAEQRREKTIGEGFFLGTLHAAKGMEFDHVFILDGDWGRPGSDNEWEAERRLLYVGMTRARETLTLMRSRRQPNRLLADLGNEHVLQRKSPVPASAIVQQDFLAYDILGLEEIFMDYAGGFPAKHPIHRHLAELATGDAVWLIRGKHGVEIRDRRNLCVGRLAARGAERWQDRLDSVAAVRILAVLQRDRLDPDAGYRERIRTDRWELPVVEVVSRMGG